MLESKNRRRVRKRHAAERVPVSWVTAGACFFRDRTAAVAGVVEVGERLSDSYREQRIQQVMARVEAESLSAGAGQSSRSLAPRPANPTAAEHPKVARAIRQLTRVESELQQLEHTLK